MSRIFWDANLFIYLFEGQGEEMRRTKRLRERMSQRGDELFTSTLALGEILVKPLAGGDRALSRNYQRIIAENAVLLPFGVDAALSFAAIRQDRTIRPADAIHLACAAAAGIDLFVTNDGRLQQKIVPGIQFIVPLDQLPL